MGGAGLMDIHLPQYQMVLQVSAEKLSDCSSIQCHLWLVTVVDSKLLAAGCFHSEL